MRKLFQFQLKNRKKPIIINYQSNFQRFTFLQTNSLNILQQNQKPSLINNNQFFQSFNINRKIINSIQQHDFTSQQLNFIKKQQYLKKESNASDQMNQQSVWNKNQQLISQISIKYDNFSKYLMQNISKQNLIQSIKIVGEINCIDIRIWQKIFYFIQNYYKNFNLQDRLIMINGISQYLKKFLPTYQINKYNTFKFMYPQNYINDLIDFRIFFKRTQYQQDFILQNDSQNVQQLKLQLLQNKIFLLMKATKKADVNIYTLRQYFNKRMPQMIRISNSYTKSFLHQKLLYNIYFIYSYLNQENDDFFKQIQKNYFSNLRRQFNTKRTQDLNNHQISIKSKQISKLLSIWKLNVRPNIQFYQQFIRPFIKFMIQNGKQINFYSTIAMNLVMAGIEDYQILNQMVQKCDQVKIRQDQILHMIKHYLNIINGNQNYLSYYKNCYSFQNIQVIKYMKSKQIKIFSNCLKCNQQKSQKQKTIKGSQFHKTQKLWGKIIKKIFQSKYKILEGVNICNYQIDFLILTDNAMVAIEIQGGHYNKKIFNKDLNLNQQVKHIGKKNIRQTVLKAYGIKIIRIHCEQKIPIFIMQSRNIQLGCQYLKAKIEQILPIQTLNL